MEVTITQRKLLLHPERLTAPLACCFPTDQALFYVAFSTPTGLECTFHVGIGVDLPKLK